MKTVYTPHTSVLYVRICRCTIWRYVHKSTLFPLATDLFSNETFASTYCEDDLIYLWLELTKLRNPAKRTKYI